MNCSKVLLNLAKVLIRNGNGAMESYAVLGDKSERAIILHVSVKKLGLVGNPRNLFFAE